MFSLGTVLEHGAAAPAQAPAPNLVARDFSAPGLDRRLLLLHEPDAADNLARRGVRADLLLAGHTHGGQVALPGLGPLLLPPLGQRYVRGWHATPAGPLYVSRGLGAVPPFIRLNAPPEVTLLTLARREDT